jgi:hypothetical protein
MAANALRIAHEMPALVRDTLRPVSAKVIHLQLEGAATERAIENWRDGYNLPRAPLWEALKNHYPELQAKSLEWHAQSFGLDPSDELGAMLRAQAELTRRINAKIGSGT